MLLASCQAFRRSSVSLETQFAKPFETHFPTASSTMLLVILSNWLYLILSASSVGERRSDSKVLAEILFSVQEAPVSSNYIFCNLQVCL